jgi:hypothetical protein
MFELKELKQWLEDISNIVIDLNISVQNSERLTEDKYDFENSIKKHGFFQLYWHQLRFVSVIQLCKLLSDRPNEKRSFLSLCNQLETQNYDSDFFDLLRKNSTGSSNLIRSTSEILNLTAWIRAEINKQKGLVEKIIVARNKVYAHKDPAANVPQIKLSEIRELANLASNIYNIINFKFFFTRTYLEMLDDWSIDYVLWYMNEVRELDEERRKSRINRT